MKHLLSTAYIYPVCPISFNHARIYVIADVYARYERLKGNEVYFPIATHFSGNTAHKVADTINNLLRINKLTEESDDPTVKLFHTTYGLPLSKLATFNDPLTILNYYNDETLKELRALGIDADYSDRYTTGDADYEPFVRAVIDSYKKHGVLKLNKNNELSLDYESSKWRADVTKLIQRTTFIEPNQQNVPLASLKNIRSDWNLLRDTGYGARYDGRIVDPMFDSELFSIFDVYIKYRDNYSASHSNSYEFFTNLLDTLTQGTEPTNELEQVIVEWLPCEHFIVEEHLRNWIAKKMHAESILLNQKYQTKKYTILGMGLIGGKRMSASKGSAILAKDLLEKYDGLTARLLMLMQGGQLSMDFNYDPRMEWSIIKMQRRFKKHLETLNARAKKLTNFPPESISAIEAEIIKSIELGKLRKALFILLERCPRKLNDSDANTAYWLTNLYNTYIGKVFAPDLMKKRRP